MKTQMDIDNNKGKVIVIEGIDGSGKETQSNRIYEILKEKTEKVVRFSFPNYSSSSSDDVKKYLNGDFGENLNPYTSSLFYARDRFLTYNAEIKKFYDAGYIILLDRYVSSNMVHQSSKIDDIVERKAYLDWLWDLEFEKNQLPLADLIVFLAVPSEYSEKLTANRNNKITGGKEKDIHERDSEHLKKSYERALELIDLYDWELINCVKDEKMRTIEDIGIDIEKAIYEYNII